jgi:hypothetical protein
MHAEALSSAEVVSPEGSSEDASISESDEIIGTGSVVSANLSSLARGVANSLDFRAGEDKFGRSRCLLPESVRRGDGVGSVVALDEYCSKLLVVTLDITSVVERTGLTVSIWGSPDQAAWSTTPLLTFRQRQYCGVYSVLLNLATHPDVRYLRVQWSTNRWGKTERVPQFGFEVFVEESGARLGAPVFA